MSHAAGRAEPPISNKTIIKVLAVCFSVIVLTILYSLSGENQSGKKEIGGKAFEAYGVPKSTEPVLYFEKGQRGVEINLRVDQWSRQIVIPTHPTRAVDYVIDVNPPIGYYVLFKDGMEEVRVDQKEITNFGLRGDVFRLLGKSSDQTAVVTIHYR